MRHRGNKDNLLLAVRTAELGQQERPDFQSRFRSLQDAEQHLEDYNSGYTRVRNHARRVLESERTIQ